MGRLLITHSASGSASQENSLDSGHVAEANIIIYEIYDDDQFILVHRVQHRRDIYRRR